MNEILQFNEWSFKQCLYFRVPLFSFWISDPSAFGSAVVDSDSESESDSGSGSVSTSSSSS